jgi:hypothetical protein
MKKFVLFLILLSMVFFVKSFSQGIVPNGDFELWTSHTNYQDPLYWDTPNAEVATIPIFGVEVVTRSTDHESGSYSVKLTTQHITLPAFDIPGFITLGNLTINLTSGTYSVTGGVPVTDRPTHLQGYYKFLPVGGDSCVIGIGMLKRQGGIRDTIGSGYFSTKSAVTDWTFFSAWIDYTDTIAPDSMNIVALSTAQETGMHAGTTLYVDNLSLDYTVSIDGNDPTQGIHIYLDNETKRILAFFDFPEPQYTSMKLYNNMGSCVAETACGRIRNDKGMLNYGRLPRGMYILEILYGDRKYCKKFMLNF